MESSNEMSETLISYVVGNLLTYNENSKTWNPVSGDDDDPSSLCLYRNNLTQDYRFVAWSLKSNSVVLNSSLLHNAAYKATMPLFHVWRDRRSRAWGLQFSPEHRRDAEDFLVHVTNVIDSLIRLKQQQQPPHKYSSFSVYSDNDQISANKPKSTGEYRSFPVEHNNSRQTSDDTMSVSSVTSLTHSMSTRSFQAAYPPPGPPSLNPVQPPPPSTPAPVPPQPPPQVAPVPPPMAPPPPPQIAPPPPPVMPPPATTPSVPPPPPLLPSTVASPTPATLSTVPPPPPPLSLMLPSPMVTPPTPASLGIVPPPPPPPLPEQQGKKEEEGEDDDGEQAQSDLASQLRSVKLRKRNNPPTVQKAKSPTAAAPPPPPPSQAAAGPVGNSSNAPRGSVSTTDMFSEMRAKFNARQNRQSLKTDSIPNVRTSGTETKASATMAAPPSTLAKPVGKTVENSLNSSAASATAPGITKQDLDQLRQDIVQEVRQELDQMKSEILKAIQSLKEQE